MNQANANSVDSFSAPLDGIIVLDLSQFLAGPYATLRLQDLGARVIKVERPDGGDLSRSLYVSDTMIEGESTIFHAINRGKDSLALDLKSDKDCMALRKLIASADIVVQNFRPGVIERLGFDYHNVRQIKPDIVYGSISGYGPGEAWAHLPGQDLLAQAKSGVMWLNGSADDGPVPFGLAVADMLAGANLAQGLLAALVQRGIKGVGAHVETSLMETMLDFQFEMLATYLNDGGRSPNRSGFRSAHAGLSAPYGVYPTSDGYLAIAMASLDTLAELLEVAELRFYAANKDSWFVKRDEIKLIIAQRLETRTTAHWTAKLEPHDIWCSKVLAWDELMAAPAFKDLDMVQTLLNYAGNPIQLMRSPIRVDGERGRSESAAPQIGAHSADIAAEFGLSLGA